MWCVLSTLSLSRAVGRGHRVQAVRCLAAWGTVALEPHVCRRAIRGVSCYLAAPPCEVATSGDSALSQDARRACRGEDGFGSLDLHLSTHACCL